MLFDRLTIVICGSPLKFSDNIKSMNEVLANSEPLINVPETVVNYLHDKHKTIINDYKTPDGKYSESCGLIALEIAELLIASGRKPYVLKIAEDVKENGFIHNKSLIPKIYDGRISWGAHQVCVCDGLAFDPILDQPIDIKNYTMKVFGDDIKTEIMFSPEETKKTVVRMNKK